EHSHPHEQVGYMVEGEAEFVVDGQSFQVRPGQMWRLPGGVVHQVTVGGKFMRVVECFCPVREDFRGKEKKV
ncbi:MAG: cupin domain-containing protein, partial [Candidatus Nealsonbacteria bacterium]|nr:cupin domain-containing protein [Candidatus Nealsonbacteria bacterium]